MEEGNNRNMLVEENNRNVVLVEKQQKCGDGCIQFHYSRSCVERKVESRVDVGSM